LSPGNGWALQVDMNQRAFEDPLAEPLKTYVVVTLRALDGNPEVHNDGIRALQTANLVSTSLPIRIPVQAYGLPHGGPAPARYSVSHFLSIPKSRSRSAVISLQLE
jgi:hypothetical protein